jgi:hypothetical protein
MPVEKGMLSVPQHVANAMGFNMHLRAATNRAQARLFQMEPGTSTSRSTHGVG